MACKSPRSFWVTAGGRLSVLPAGTVLPGQDQGIASDVAGFKGSGMHSGQLVTVDCRTCWSCIIKYQNSLVGSLLAETAYADRSVSLTMTYANDPGSDTRSDLAHMMLNGGHIREFTERLRKARGFGRVRYLVAGEYGPLYGRAHWHAVLVFTDGMPEFDFTAPRYNDNRLWPYGFIQARPCEDEAGFAYAVKYAVKSTKALANDPHYMPGVETVMRRSRIPPLGLPFFLERAEQQADFGVPLSMRYMPPGGQSRANYHVRGLVSRLGMAHAYLDRLEDAGHDVSFYGQPPRGHVLTGPHIPITADKDIGRLIETALRERRLAAMPQLTPEQDAAEFEAKMRERQARHERILKAEERRRLAVDLARSKEWREKLDADRRVAAEVQRLKDWSDRLGPSRFVGAADPFEADDFASAEVLPGQSAFDVLKTGSWRDF